MPNTKTNLSIGVPSTGTIRVWVTRRPRGETSRGKEEVCLERKWSVIRPTDQGRKWVVSIVLWVPSSFEDNFWGLRISVIAGHLFGFTSISRWVSMKPKNLQPSTPNAHSCSSTLALQRPPPGLWCVGHMSLTSPLCRPHRPLHTDW